MKGSLELKQTWRHTAILALALVMMMLMLGACGSRSAGEDAAADSRLYKDGLGREVAIPVQPQRVVVLEFIGDLLTLGVQPVGVPQYDVGTFQTQLNGATGIGQDGDYEKIASLNPDLIIVPDYAKPEAVEAYAKIAPTVAVAWNATILEQLHAVADILGKTAEEKAWLERYTKKGQEVKEQLADSLKQGETLAVLQVSQKSIYAYAPRLFANLYQVLGFQISSKMKELVDNNASFAVQSLSFEALPEYAADRLFIIVSDNDEARNVMKQMESSDVWKSLAAVKQGHVYFLSDRWANYSAATLDWQLDEMKKLFATQP